jgi:excisionase family DNA binding protein
VTVSEQNEAELLTTAEVAEYAKVSPQTVRRWRYDGDLEFVRLGYRTIRHRRADVVETIHRLHRKR